MNKIKFFILTFTLPVVIFSSSFGSSTDGGIELSESEKFIFENRKNIKSSKKDLTRIKLKVNSLEDSVDGLKSVVESINDKISKDIQTKSQESSVDSIELKKLKKTIEENETANKKRFKELEKSIAKLIKLVSSNTTLKKPIKLKKKIIKAEKKLSAKESFNRGLKKLSSKKYTNARSYFLDSSEGNYRPATSYFKIGETLYYQRKFEEAIVYYKKSVDKDDKTSFISTLMLHTGISFLKTSDKDGAKKFLEAVIGGYPESKEAVIAKKYLKKL